MHRCALARTSIAAIAGRQADHAVLHDSGTARMIREAGWRGTPGEREGYGQPLRKLLV